jgi:hypothetical protein
MIIDGVSGRSIRFTRELFKPSCSNRWWLFKTSHGIKSAKSMWFYMDILPR